jgi:hypothetical protein
MKLKDVTKEQRDLDLEYFQKKVTEGLKQSEKGTYSGVRFNEDTVNNIRTFIEEEEIPNGVPDNKLHSTILYSRKHCPNYEPRGDLDEPLVGTPTEFDVWQSQPDEDGNKSNCLIMKYDCDGLVERHKQLMDEHDATFDYDKFRPHVTLSYDIGDMNIDNLDPSKIGDLNIVKEYGEDLDMDWARSNT